MSVNAQQCTRRFFLQAATGYDNIERSEKGTYLYRVGSDYVWIHRAKEETRWVAGHKPTRDRVLRDPNVRETVTDTGANRLIHVIVIADRSEFYHHIERGDAVEEVTWYAFPTSELKNYARLSGQTYHITERELENMEHFYQDQIGHLPVSGGHSQIPQNKWVDLNQFEKRRQKQAQNSVRPSQNSNRSQERVEELREVYENIVG